MIGYVLLFVIFLVFLSFLASPGGDDSGFFDK